MSSSGSAKCSLSQPERCVSPSEFGASRIATSAHAIRVPQWWRWPSRRTGLDRSSLYNSFGSKQGIFEAALRSYLEEGIEARLTKLRQPTAGLGTVVAFFVGMAHTLRTDRARAERGCESSAEKPAGRGNGAKTTE